MKPQEQQTSLAALNPCARFGTDLPGGQIQLFDIAEHNAAGPEFRRGNNPITDTCDGAIK